MESEAASPSWFVRLGDHPLAAVRLFCFPHAGGAVWVYRDWAAALGPGIELFGVQLPGRSTRSAEPARVKLGPLAAEIADALQALEDARPFALLGHSLGAVLAFECARELTRRGRPPLHVFCLGASAPGLPPSRAPLHDCPDGELLARLRDAGGLPPELLAHEELVAAVLPILRADLTLAETHSHTEGPRLDCALTVLGGRDDPLAPRQRLAPWREQTTGTFGLRLFPGGHFFVRDEAEAVRAHVLAELVRSARGL
jgi:medium-chain acyl-[acyl-carrier-protein] hydrolase